MRKLPHQLYRADQLRELERIAIDIDAIPGYTLMERAGSACWQQLRRRWPRLSHLAILCGTGNNGGDGFIIARLAHEVGLTVSLLQLGDPQHLQGDALRARRSAEAAGLTVEGYRPEALKGCELIVDALLGTGIQGEVRGEWQQAIAAINHHPAPVVAVDIPSGLDADSGATRGVAVEATLTVTFIALKLGLFTGRGPHYSGEIQLASLAISEAHLRAVEPVALRYDWSTVHQLFAPRPADAHKGAFGHVLVVGGDHGFSGAAYLAACAAARCGAGRVSIATRAAHAPLLNVNQPELMCHGVETTGGLRALLKQATVVVVGPGLGQGAWGQQMLATVLESRLPLVVDADALNLLAQEPERHDNWVLTPHPGEAARLLGSSPTEIEANRLLAAIELEVSFGGVVVLKGAGSLVQCGERVTALCSDGNPGMASGGMGDLLSGCIAALLAQGFGLSDAARLGVALHAAAGDLAAVGGERGMLASDLLPAIRHLVNG